MKMPLALALLACLLLWEPPAGAETPLATPLGHFDQLVSQLKAESVVGEPIRVGDTALVPFAAIQFGLGGGGGMVAFGGGMDAKTVPLGILIVEGDDVRAELFPGQETGPTLFQEILQAIRERKVVIMGNGVNLGQTSGNVQDLAPLISRMMGQTTFVGNALNLGALSSPASSLDELETLFGAKKYGEALAVAEALLAKDPKSAEAHAWKGRILSRLAEADPRERTKLTKESLGEFEKALSLDPGNPDAHLGRGLIRLMQAPERGGDLHGAVADFEAALAKKPSAEGYFSLGEAWRRQGRNDEAAAAYGKALELQPDYAEATKALAETK
jgi:uncharacterized spore protein YtfJ